MTLFISNLTTPPSRGALSQDYWMVAKHVNNKNAGKPRVLAINAPLHSLAALAETFSVFVTLNNDAKPPPKWILREFDVSRIRPPLGGLPHLETFTWQNMTPAERVTRSGGPCYPPWWVTPHLSCKSDHIRMRDYKDRRVTPPKRVTSPTWGPHLHVNRPLGSSTLNRLN